MVMHLKSVRDTSRARGLVWRRRTRGEGRRKRQGFHWMKTSMDSGNIRVLGRGNKIEKQTNNKQKYTSCLYTRARSVSEGEEAEGWCRWAQIQKIYIPFLVTLPSRVADGRWMHVWVTKERQWMEGWGGSNSSLIQLKWYWFSSSSKCLSRILPVRMLGSFFSTLSCPTQLRVECREGRIMSGRKEEEMEWGWVEEGKKERGIMSSERVAWFQVAAHTGNYVVSPAAGRGSR